MSPKRRAFANNRRRRKGRRDWTVLLPVFLLMMVGLAFYANRLLGPVSRDRKTGPESPSRSGPGARRQALQEASASKPTSALPSRAEPVSDIPAGEPERRPDPEIARPRWSFEEMQKEMDRGAAGGKRIALTFDAGSSGEPTPKILRALKAHGLQATFFLTGKWAEDNPDLVRQIAADGHEFGNHTYAHKDMTKLSEGEILEELERTERIVQKLTGKSTKPLFRPPFGSRDERLLKIVASAGYRCIYWTLDSWDSVKKDITSREIASRVLDKSADGSIVLMHCGSAPTADALPEILDQLAAKGYQVVSVSGLAGG